MSYEHGHGMRGFQHIIAEIESIALEASSSATISDRDLSAILSFLRRVSGVLEQAFQNVLELLIDIKLLREKDLLDDTLHDVRRRVELILSRSHYRDAEEICSQLRSLHAVYRNELAEQFDRMPGRKGWSGLLGLIEEREGRVIDLIASSVHQIANKLQMVEPDNLPELREFASERVEDMKRDLNELRSFTGKILGISGRAGMLEMLSDPANRPLIARQISISLDQSRHHTSASHGSTVINQSPNFSGQVSSNYQRNEAPIDLSVLAGELERLRRDMKNDASAREHDMAIGQIARAEAAARQGDRGGALAALKASGLWALGMAEKIGVSVASQALKTSLGL